MLLTSGVAEEVAPEYNVSDTLNNRLSHLRGERLVNRCPSQDCERDGVFLHTSSFPRVHNLTLHLSARGVPSNDCIDISYLPIRQIRSEPCFALGVEECTVM
eukprot:scaffold2059_cov90-Alexandrium_tamarense.AAC.2